MLIELIIFIIVITIEILLVKKLLNRIKVLEGFLPICANCKKIRIKDKWEQIDAHISNHSLVKFSHPLCPECEEKL